MTETVHEWVNRQNAAKIPSYYLGVDLGQKQDYTALAVIEEPVWIPDEVTQFAYRAPATGWVSPADLMPAHLTHLRAVNYGRGRPAHPPLSLRHIERVPLHTRYPAIVERVVALMRSPPLLGATKLVVDATGVGAPVVDLFRAALDGLVEITITGGTNVVWDAEGEARYRVPKRDLVSSIQALLQSDRLKIARAMPEAGTLIEELLNFRVTIDPQTAHDSYAAWREGIHDDLVLATALPCWYRGYLMVHVDRAHAQHARGARGSEYEGN